MSTRLRRTVKDSRTSVFDSLEDHGAADATLFSISVLLAVFFTSRTTAGYDDPSALERDPKAGPICWPRPDLSSRAGHGRRFPREVS